jgi:[ribosomal protein S5]-alanine N-acetyltransferase
MYIKGTNIFLRILSTKDVNQDYVDWMNDMDVVDFLDSKWKSFILDDLIEYVQKMNNSHNNFLFGIFDSKTKKHIGNIKIGNINFINRHGSIGIIIGNKDYWGKGVATEAIELVTKCAFEDLNLHKVTAGMYAVNNSHRAFIKNGFKESGLLKDHVYLKGKYVDVIKVEKLNRT